MTLNFGIYFSFVIYYQNLRKSIGVFLYTDGTKSQNNISAYAIVNDFSENLLLSILYQHSSVFTAESCAFYQAIRLIQRHNIKTVIFFESLSVLKTICYLFNNKWIIINKIRDSLVKYNIRKIHWIASRIGFAGNEKVDIFAIYASYAPVITDNTLEKRTFAVISPLSSTETPS